jgi:hypothetical protein
MKKALALLLALFLVPVVVGCDSAEDEDAADNASDTNTTESED